MKPGDRITVPLFSVAHQEIGGTESSIYNLVAALQAAGAETHVSYSRPERLSPEFRAWLTGSGVSQHRQAPLPGPKNIRFLEEALFEALRRDRGWVLYPNYFLPPHLLHQRHRPTAVLLHDIQYKVLPDFHSPRRRAWLDFYLPKMFELADVVLLISQAEQALVAEHFGAAAAAKCQVIYNAIDWSRFEVGPLRAEVEDLAAADYLLAVCQPLPHKNIRTLVEAFNEVSQVRPELRLYLVGAQSQVNMALVQAHASAAAARQIMFPGFLSDRELGHLYERAKLFVHPSLYEGFGMPAVEVLGLGVPALVSDIPALREVTLGRAQYVQDLRSPDAWRSAILRQLERRDSPSTQSIALLRSAYSLGTVGANVMAALV